MIFSVLLSKQFAISPGPVHMLGYATTLPLEQAGGRRSEMNFQQVENFAIFVAVEFACEQVRAQGQSHSVMNGEGFGA